ncbi:hypothetical protein C8J56DRAFT_906844 [Mycena floridula]|nr:hypothetical protein C8J56DRAFT_906844 [Mycena floridula]
MADQLNDPMVLQNIISRISPAVLLALEPSQLNDAAFLCNAALLCECEPLIHATIAAKILEPGLKFWMYLELDPHEYEGQDMIIEWRPFLHLTVHYRCKWCVKENKGQHSYQGPAYKEDVQHWTSSLPPLQLPTPSPSPYEKQVSRAAPFIGYIINLNVTRDGRLDIKDRDLCATMPFAEWEAGQIVFYQLDIFTNLNPLDIVIFPSNHITHFNLCHKHKHGSVVTLTDKGFDAWVKDENGYAGENFGVGVFKWSNVLVVVE